MNESRWKKYLSLFIQFFKIGAFTFGGGYAMIPIMQREFVENHHYIEKEDILDIMAISQSTPGAISVNSATFIGQQVAGFWGAFFATVGLIIPPYIFILLISGVLGWFESQKYVQYAFMGIRAGVLALIAKAMITMFKQCPKNVLAYFLMLASLAASVIFDVNLIIILVVCAVIGLVASLINKKQNGEVKK